MLLEVYEQAILKNHVGKLSAFRPFCPGYFWQPYTGELYNPIVSSSQREVTA